MLRPYIALPLRRTPEGETRAGGRFTNRPYPPPASRLIASLPPIF